MAPKIISTQDAVLSDYEVLQHVKELKQTFRSTGRARKIPANLAAILDKVENHLERAAGPYEPGSAVHPTWSDRTVARLVRFLKPFGLLRAEILMVLNLRPASRTQLEPLLEECNSRFTDEQLYEIIGIIYDQPTADGAYDEPEPEPAAAVTAAHPPELESGTNRPQNSSRELEKTQKESRLTTTDLAILMNRILKGEAPHNAIPAPTREQLINKWEGTKAQFDQQLLPQWDKSMSAFMDRLYGSWALEHRLPPPGQPVIGPTGIPKTLDLDGVVEREKQMLSEAAKQPDWILDPPAERIPRFVRQEKQ